MNILFCTLLGIALAIAAKKILDNAEKLRYKALAVACFLGAVGCAGVFFYQVNETPQMKTVKNVAQNVTGIGVYRPTEEQKQKERSTPVPGNLREKIKWDVTANTITFPPLGNGKTWIVKHDGIQYDEHRCAEVTRLDKWTYAYKGGPIENPSAYVLGGDGNPETGFSRIYK